jgi:hypothetical protein
MSGEFGGESSIVTPELIQIKLNDLGFILESEYRIRASEFPLSEPYNLGNMRARLNIPTETLTVGTDLLHQLEVWIETVQDLGVGGIHSATTLEELNDAIDRAVDHTRGYMLGNGYELPAEPELN